MKTSLPVKPFLKWAGGKTQLIEQIANYFPEELIKGSIQRYIEPFIGGGAVFIYIAQLYKVEELFISDVNPDLFIAYKTIQDHVEELISSLSDIQTKYLSLDEDDRESYFYQVRSEFNFQRKQINFKIFEKNWIQRTSQMVFLNRTCFNGLFRVNSRGDFNVPFGRYKKPTICDATNLLSLFKILKKTQIHNADFTECEKFVNKHTFVYFDPPYRPISKTANFTSYANAIFDDKEQLRLRDFFILLDQKGAKLLLSNSDPTNENSTDLFFELSYQAYRIKKVQASRNINSKSSKRGKINELLIMNY